MVEEGWEASGLEEVGEEEEMALAGVAWEMVALVEVG